MAPALDSSSSSNSSSVSATMRRRHLSLPPPDEGDDRRRSSRFGSVQQYQLEKQLDPQQLDKIIYQPGCSYSTAVAGQHATSATATEFNLSGFSQHLARSQCLSVLLFWKEAEEYLNMFSQGDRAACAQRIFQRYMRKGAEFEINLSGINDATVAGIEAKLTKPPEDLFAHAQECAYRMLALELFPRFWDAIKSQDAPRPSSYSAKLTSYSGLRDVLSDEKGVMFFSEYCKTHYCEEQVLFWLEARDHQLLFDPSDLLSQGLLIFDTYVKLSAECRINISATATQAVEARLSSGSVDRTLFDEVAQEVETFLELDLWPRYKEAVMSGAYDPGAGRVDVEQRATKDDAAKAEGDVDLSKPSKAAVRAALNHPEECDRMREAASKQGCPEMIDYCRDCAEYEKLFSDADRLTKAQTMHRKYLSSGCDYPVNIPDTQLKAIQKKIDQPTATIFKKSYEECLQLISDNIYNSYLEMQAANRTSSAAGAPPVCTPKPPKTSCCAIS